MRKVFSDTFIDYNLNPKNIGETKDADGFAKVTGPCGDTMKIWLKADNDTITDARFMTDGCGTTIASGGMITEMGKGRTILNVQKTSQQDVLDGLGVVPEDSQHCALLAANTLKATVRDYMTTKKEPWKRA